MRTLLILFMVFVLFGCGNKPQYEVGTCFMVSPFMVISIDRVDDQYYHCTVYFIAVNMRMTHKMFEKEIEYLGLIPKSCKEPVQ